MGSRSMLWPEYVQYILLANSRHGTHSPFVYEFADRVLYKKYDHPMFYDIELIRQRMLQSKAEIEVTDWGAAGNNGSVYLKPISKMVARAAKSSKYAKLLYRICAYYRPTYAIELGTNFGISTLYQLAGSMPGHFITIEGCKNTAEIARYNFSKLNLEQSVHSLIGTFDQVLPGVVEQVPRVDYAFVDGNHRKDPTLRYFEMLLPKLHNESIVIFDDIRWSKEMREAWEEIKQHERVRVSIDLFFMGIVFLRQEQTKEHFTLRF